MPTFVKLDPRSAWLPAASSTVTTRPTVLAAGTLALTAGAASVAVAFSPPLTAVPTAVLVTVSSPNPSTTGAATLFAGTEDITAAGFTARLSAEVPAHGTYRLHWVAL